MLLLLDIGNTHTHVGWCPQDKIVRHVDLETSGWKDGSAGRRLIQWLGKRRPNDVSMCSVVPEATSRVMRFFERSFRLEPFNLTSRSLRGLGVDYPRPRTIGPDRLANSLAARTQVGAPVVVVDFGTAVTFDVVDERGYYVGGIIAPGLAAMTDYLHEKTALLPRIHIREVQSVIGKTTREAMLIGAVHGYRGLIRELLQQVSSSLGRETISVIATGGYAQLIASKMPEINAVEPLLTLEGVRLAFLNREGTDR